MSIVKSIALSIMLGVVSYGSTYKCTSLIDIDMQEELNVSSTITASAKTARIVIDGIGTFNYKFAFKTPSLTSYNGTDNMGHLSYSALLPNTISLSETAGVSGCKKVKQ